MPYNSGFTNFSFSSCDAYCILDQVFFVYSSVTLVVYILVISSIVKSHKKLASSFYTICISVGCADIYYTIHKYAFTTIPRWFFKEYFLGSSWLGLFTKTVNWALYYSSIPGVILMALNRYTALNNPMQYKLIWDKKKVKKGILIHWLFGFLWVPFMVLPGYSCRYTEEFSEPKFDDPKVENFYWTCCVLIECFLFAPTLIYLYSAMVIAVVKQRSKISPQQARGNRKASSQSRFKMELRLAAIGLITTSMYLSLCGFWLCILFNFTPKFVTTGWYYLSDMFVLSNPWLLLVFSTQVRECFVLFMTCKKKRASQPKNVPNIKTKSTRVRSALQATARVPSRVAAIEIIERHTE